MLEFQVLLDFETSIIPNVSNNKIINNGPDPSIKVEIPIYKGRFNLEILFIIIILDL